MLPNDSFIPYSDLQITAVVVVVGTFPGVVVEATPVVVEVSTKRQVQDFYRVPQSRYPKCNYKFEDLEKLPLHRHPVHVVCSSKSFGD